MMEYHHDNNLTSIHLLRDASETVTFPINWNSFLYNIQHALFSTARGRYKRWLDRQLSKQISVEPGPSNKRKQSSNSASSQSRQRR
ncbi:hypothetical protein OG21DRAFT_923479 [Imleria badia]|nr:hypothetical protein OG21DRAFT_923479 [Imleria badia]